MRLPLDLHISEPSQPSLLDFWHLCHEPWPDPASTAGSAGPRSDRVVGVGLCAQRPVASVLMFVLLIAGGSFGRTRLEAVTMIWRIDLAGMGFLW